MEPFEGYFDYASATPMSDVVLRSMQPYWALNFYNPSAIYINARKIKQDVSVARAQVSSLLGARPSEIIFTAGGTEANNLAVQGVMRRHLGKNIIVSAIEHESVLEPAKDFDHKILPVDKKGFVDSNNLDKIIDENTVLISCMLVNNEIGTIQKVSHIVELANSVRRKRKESGNATPLYVHTDACQALNYLDLMTGRLGVDLMTINAGKIYGPKQCGALFVRSGTHIEPLIYGGGQEGALRSGTENVPAIIGFSVALKETTRMRHHEESRLQKLRDKTINMILEIPGSFLNGPTGKQRVCNNINLTFEGVDNERLLMELDERGFMVATGSACSASSEEPSHVLKSIGLNDEQIRSSLRITLGRHSTEETCQKLAKTLKECVEKIRA